MAPGTAAGAESAPPQPPGGGCPPPPGAVTVARDDARYADLTRVYNGRHTARPESVRVVYTADQIVAVVEEAVRAGKRIAVRSGGHCFEDFVHDPDVQIIVDVSQMHAVYFDSLHRAYAVEAGATLGHLYRSLYLGWGVTVPGGGCPSVGVGGHILGGGYGALSRKHGLVIDHLYGVEVVVVEKSGRVRRVLATRDPRDPDRDLWWAHAGGGGGNFGIVVRYLLRSPSADGDALLPRPPRTVPATTVTWRWDDVDERAFTRLLRNHAEWHERDEASGKPQVDLGSSLLLTHRATGQFQLFVHADGENADRLMREYVDEVTRGVGASPTTEKDELPWLTNVLSTESYLGGHAFKSKAAFLRARWTDGQIATVHKYLNDGDERWGASVYLTALGGQVNAAGPADTAFPHRNSIFSVVYDLTWEDPGNEGELAWIRRFYRDVYAETGGVPVAGKANDGCYINYPDADVADPEWNTSGVPWHALYYGDNYPRLQRVKARWDPRNVFRHRLSVRPPR